LNNAISIWLDVDLKTLTKRIERNEKRPLLNNMNKPKKMEELYEERKNTYKLANHKLKCDKLSKEDIVKKIIHLYEKY